MAKEDFSNIKEVKFVPSNFFKTDFNNEKIISREQYVNSLLNNGWVILDIYEGNFVLGLPSNNDKLLSEISTVK